MNRGRIAGALAALLLVSLPAHAYIRKVFPVKDLIRDADSITTVKIDALDPSKPSMTLSFDRNLKGKAPFEKIDVDMTGEAEKGPWPSGELQKRLAPGLTVVVFGNPKGTAQARFKHHLFLYTNGTWFQIAAIEPKDGGPLYWKYRNCEPYLRRTFKGTTEEMRQTVLDGLLGKKEPPAFDPDEKEGLGPVVEKK